MTDQFLIKFALSTLVIVAFALQHGSQIAARNLGSKSSRDTNVALSILILTMQLASAGIIVEIISYALKK
jgi:hypothetical protein